MSSSPPPKRRKHFVDATGTKLATQSRRQTNAQGDAQRTAAHSAIVMVYKEIVIKTKMNVGEALLDPFLSVVIMNQVSSGLQATRQFKSGGGILKRYNAVKSKGFDLTYRGTTYTMGGDVLLDICGKQWDDYITPKSAQGTLMSILALYCLWGERLNEMRVGIQGLYHSTDSTSGDVSLYRLASLGIPDTLKHYAYGVGYSPLVASAQPQSQGPLAVACRLAVSVGSTAGSVDYQQKWVTAFNRVFQHIPNHSEIAAYMKGNNASSCRGIIAQLANLLCIVGGRQQNRWVKPPCDYVRHLLMKSAPTKDVDATMFDKPNFSDSGINDVLNFSSRAGMIVSGTMVAKVPPGAKSYVEEIIFHCTAGTAGEDFGVLSKITNRGTWRKRNEMKYGTDDIFHLIRPAADSCNYIDVNPIKMKVWSKMAGASMTNLLHSGTSQVGSVQVFSGYRNKKVTAEMMQALKGQAMKVGYATDQTAIIRDLKVIAKSIEDKIDGMTSIDAGTAEWVNEKDETVQLKPQETGVFFWTN